MTLNSNLWQFNWINQWSELAARKNSDAIVLTEYATGNQYTAKDLSRWSDSIALYLKESHQIQKGDVVALFAMNSAESVALFLALSKLGAILAPVSHHAQDAVVTAVFERLQPKCIVVDETLASKADNVGLKKRYSCLPLSAFKEDKLSPSAEFHAIEMCLEDICLFVHTTGTTGVPKICRISYRQLHWNMHEFLAYGMLKKSPVRLAAFPFYLIGCWASFLPSMMVGTNVVILPEFHSTMALDAIQKYRVNLMTAVNAMLKFMLEDSRFSSTDLSSLRGLLLAGAPSEPAVRDAYWAKGVRITQAYGQTETGPSNFADPLVGADAEQLKARCHTVGYATSFTDFRILNPYTNEPCEIGEEGVLLLRSPHEFSGYWNDETLTNRVIAKSGWVNTRDWAMQQPDRALVLQRRETDRDYFVGEDMGIPENYDDLPMDWIGHALEKRATFAGNVAAIVDAKTGQETSYARAATIVYQWASQIRQNVESHSAEAILIQTNDATAWLYSFFAAQAAGVPILFGGPKSGTLIISSEANRDGLMIPAWVIDVDSNVKPLSIEDSRATLSLNDLTVVADRGQISHRQWVWQVMSAVTTFDLQFGDRVIVAADNIGVLEAVMLQAFIQVGAVIIPVTNSQIDQALVDKFNVRHIVSSAPPSNIAGDVSVWSSNEKMDIAQENYRRLEGDENTGLVGYWTQQQGVKTFNATLYADVEMANGQLSRIRSISADKEGWV